MAAAEIQFISLTEAALSKSESDCQPKTSISTRSSASVFNRRSDEAQRNKPPSVKRDALSSPQTPLQRQKSWLSHREAASGHPRQPSHPEDAPKPKSWLSERDDATKHRNWFAFPKRSSASRRSNKVPTPTKPKGTVLNLVPPAPMISMTLLEEEMATSPNEEILSAVSGSPVSPGPPLVSLWNAPNMSLTQRTRSVVRKETNARIGTWVNGVVKLDEEYLDRWLGDEGPSLPAQASFASCTPMAERPSKPMLSVIIPGKDLGIIDWKTSKVCQPAPKRCVSVTPPGVVSQYHLSPSNPDLLSHIVSPLEGMPVIARPITPPERPKAPLQPVKVDDNLDAEIQHELSSPSTFCEGPSSGYSEGSSRTSIEVIHEDEKVESEGPAPQTALLQYLNKPLPAVPPPPQRAPPPPPPPTVPKSSVHSPSKSNHQPSTSSRSTPSLKRDRAPPRPMRSQTSHSLDDTNRVNGILRLPTTSGLDESLTLHEAETALQDHLSQLSSANGPALSTVIDEEAETRPGATNPSSYEGPARRNSVRSVMQPPHLQRAPTLPRRSRRRDWCMTRSRSQSRISSASSALTRRKSDGDVSQHVTMQGAILAKLRRSNSCIQLSNTTNDTDATSIFGEACAPNVIIDDGMIVIDGPDDMYHRKNEHALAAAHGVLLHILQALPTWSDLQNTAQINKGMYRVYKDNEMDLTRSVLKNHSPAAWELREWLPPTQYNDVGTSPTSSQLEYTPQEYINCYQRDLDLIKSIKMLIMEHCSSVVRAETVAGLSGDSQRFDDAIWRIWSFCRIFGCGKGREDDVTGQLDWLKGGILANNQDLTATANINLDFDDIGGILLNAPEHFAKGNGNGLSADQLYDMLEIWTCLTTILQGYHSRSAQAAEYGIFDNCNVEGQYTEEQLFEEWTAHIMTLGPVAIFELAEYAYDQSGFGFALAKENGWTDWSLTQQGTSRTTFLKEPISRLYEERVATATMQLEHPHRQELKEISRKRVANMAAEIKIARRASTFRRLPVTDMSNERPWSMVTRQSSMASMRMPPSPCTPALSKSASTLSPSRSTELLFPVSALSRTTSTETFSHDPQTPTFSLPYHQAPPPPSLGVVEERDEGLGVHALQHFAQGDADETSSRAVKLIVSMGFPPAQAREALMVTDVGVGLRVDWAVELLLRRGS